MFWKSFLQTKYLVWKTISEWELWAESNTGFPVLSRLYQYFFWKFLGSLSIYSLFLKIYIPTTESQCTESWNHWGWKRHPRSPSPTRTGQCHSVWFETLQWTFLQVMNVFLPLTLYFGNNLLRRKMNSRYSWTKRQWRHRWKYSKAWKVKAFQIPAMFPAVSYSWCMDIWFLKSISRSQRSPPVFIGSVNKQGCSCSPVLPSKGKMSPLATGNIKRDGDTNRHSAPANHTGAMLYTVLEKGKIEFQVHPNLSCPARFGV